MLTDFGVARIAEVSFEHEMTQGPGTEVSKRHFPVFPHIHPAPQVQTGVAVRTPAAPHEDKRHGQAMEGRTSCSPPSVCTVVLGSASAG